MRVETVTGPLVVGSGLAGLTLAAHRPGCTVLTADGVGAATSTALAQGGLAAAVGVDDSVELHAADTLAAGAGLCDRAAVQAITADGPSVVERLARLGTRFDTRPDGIYALGLEGAHSRHRVLHAAGDASGAELLRATAQAALRQSTVWTSTRVLRVLVADGRALGVLAERDGERLVVAAGQVVLATGGLGGLFTHTTNPLGSRGQGLALAARAGATLRDVEMVQFHPTALDIGLDPMPLVSEAVRGAGAVLVTEEGPFVDSLATRDVVSRAVWREQQAGRLVLLDARGVTAFGEHFPGIERLCRAAGLDPSRDLLPIRPAVHYHMGGVRADLDGATDVLGLSALGECASTGLHGANRLASNSLLEAASCGCRAALSRADVAAPDPRAALAAVPEHVETAPAPVPVRDLVEQHAGILRSREGLLALESALAPWAEHDDAFVGLAIARAALSRTESRGAHTRTDHPGTDTVAHHTLTPALQEATR